MLVFGVGWGVGLLVAVWVTVLACAIACGRQRISLVASVTCAAILLNILLLITPQHQTSTEGVKPNVVRS